MAEMRKTLITKAGLEKMQKELEDLRTTKRAEVPPRTAQIIVKGKKNRIDVGSTVTIEDMEEHVKETVTIVGSAESNPFEGRISNESPVGRALVGAKAGDIVEADAPNSVIKYKVISIDD